MDTTTFVRATQSLKRINAKFVPAENSNDPRIQFFILPKQDFAYYLSRTSNSNLSLLKNRSENWFADEDRD